MCRLSKILRLAVFVLAIFIAGCSFGPREINAPRTYFLNPEISWKNPRSPAELNGDSVLLITQPRAQAGFDSARMAYLLRPYEVSYYGYSQWADTPARMLHRVMVEGFDMSGLWSAVLQTPGAAPAQYRLDCDNLVLEQQFFSQPSRVRLALRAQIVKTKTQMILDTRYFEFSETAPSDDPYGGVVAANHAAAKLITEMAEWLNLVVKENN
jgi:cholesterol transport system auxiliary component